MLLSWGVAGACGGALSSWLLRRGVAATGEGSGAESSVAEAGASASWGFRVTPVRAGDRRDFDGVDDDSPEESALSVDGVVADSAEESALCGRRRISRRSPRRSHTADGHSDPQRHR